MYSKQKASALAISLILLTAITLISISSLQRSGLQTRIVANNQHAEAGFNAANSELEEMFRTYITDNDALSALSESIYSISSTTGANEPTVETGVDSTYTATAANRPLAVDLSSSILHTGKSPFTAGYSQGGFATYGFRVSTTASAPNNGRTLSSQSIGIEFIGPAQN